MEGHDQPSRPNAEQGSELPAPPTLPQPTGDATLLLPPRSPEPATGRPSGSDAEPTPYGRTLVDDHQPAVLGRSRVMEAPEPVRLRRSKWAGALFTAAAVVSLPLHMMGAVLSLNEESEMQSAGAGVSGLASLLLIVGLLSWTWVNVDNARRLLTHSRHHGSVSPWRGVLWWLAAPIVGFVLVVIGRVTWPEYFDPNASVTGDDEVVRAFLVLGFVLVVLLLAIRPYLYLGNVMKRIHGDPVLFTRWLWVPIVFTALAGLGVIGLGSLNFDAEGTRRTVLSALILLAAIIPYLMWCVMGRRAMAGMDAIARARSAGQFEQRRVYVETQRHSMRNELADAPAPPR